MNDPGHCIIPRRPSEVGAIWTFTNRADAAEWRRYLKDEEGKLSRIVERSLRVANTKTPIYCLIIE